MKVIDLLKHAVENYGDRVAVNYDEVKSTYRELYRSIENIKDALVRNGVMKGDKIGLIMDNSIEFIEVFFAVNLCEAVIIPIYANTGIDRLSHIIRFYGIDFIVFNKRTFKIFDSFDRDSLSVRAAFLANGSGISAEYCNSGLIRSGDLAENASGTGGRADTALILFSSGTTNIPKGVMLSNRNIVSNVQAISEYLNISNDNVLLIKNINHASSITGEMLVSLYNGCTLFITSKVPVPSLILRLIEEKSISVFFAVPTILYSILRDKNLNKYNLKALKIINFYGASIDYSKIKELSEKLPDTELIYSYGLTEASPRVTYIYKQELLEKRNSSGRPVKDVEVFIVDEEGNNVKENVIGEITVKGPNVMQGYYKNDDLTRKAILNGVLYTGDLGYLDLEGYLYVTGRKDNLIIQSGKNIYPEEIEGILYNFHGIKDVLVRGEHNDYLGSKIVAYIVPADDIELNVKEVYNYCRINLEDYKIPGEIFIVRELEKTPSGKTSRRQNVDLNVIK